jgi:nucleotide-binding universal stress UspA family protein
VSTLYESILVPSDGSDPAARALDHAVALAGRFDATVRLLRAVDEWNLERVPDSEDSRLQAAEETVAAATERVAGAGVEVEEVVDVGVPHEVVLDHGADADLVVMGSHGRTGLERYLLGSVTEKVVRLSDVPVLTVHAQEGTVPRYPYEAVVIPTAGSECRTAALDHGVEVAAAHGATVHGVSVVDDRASTHAPEAGEEFVESLTERAERAVQ